MIDDVYAQYHNKNFNAVLEKSIQIIKIDPEHVDAWKLFAAAQKAQRNTAEAAKAFQKVCNLQPENSDNYVNLGIVLIELGHITSAIQNLNIAIKINPTNDEAYFNIANAYKEAKKYSKAILNYKMAIKLNALHSNAYNNMGIALKELAKIDEAVLSYQRAIQIEPYNSKFYNNIGNAFKDQKNYDNAVKAFMKAIKINPKYAEAYNNLGIIFIALNEMEKALHSFNAALALKQNYPEAYNNKGIALKKLKIYDDAEICLRKAIYLRSNYAEAYRNLGAVLDKKGEKNNAIEAYNNALSIKPDFEGARVEKLFLHAQLCQWNAIDENRKYIRKIGTEKQPVPLFSLLSLDNDPAQQLKRAKKYTTNYSSNNARIYPDALNKKSRKIKIGYFSSDFRQHPVGYLIARTIETHNRNEFEVLGYDLSGDDKSEIYERFKNTFDKFTDISHLSDNQAIDLIRSHNIDIAINLNGYTEGERTPIFSSRISPIQINYLGYPGTMGAQFIDYMISDKFVVPESSKKYYTEKQIYMPYSYMPTDNTRVISEDKITRYNAGLPEKSFIMCCFNNSYKIGRHDFHSWLKCLQQSENSVLWLRKPHKICIDNLRAEAKIFQIDPARIIFADKVPMGEHLARHMLADVFVDTSTFNAHTTAVDALWAGLPVITLPGKSFASRVAGSLLTSLDLPELIAKNREEYQEIILRYTFDLEALQALKKKLLKKIKNQPLFSSEQQTRYLEYAYNFTYINHMAGKSPQSFCVPRNVF